MKTGVIALLLLGLGAAGAQTPSTQKPAAQPATAAPTETTAAAPVKRPPQAKTQPEFDAYQAAMKSANDPPAIDKAADDFAVKYPTSELRILLFRAAMHSYQAANNGPKMMETGRKVLAIDPDDPEALLAVSEVLVEQTNDNDLDKNQKWDEALKMARRSLETVDTDINIPPGTPQQKVDDYKNFLKSSADGVIGAIQYDQEKFVDAEQSLRNSIDVYPSQPDPIAVFRLALSLDKQEKYPEALKYANQAVDLTQENTSVGTAARHERDRLVQLTGGVLPASKPTTGASSAPPTN